MISLNVSGIDKFAANCNLFVKDLGWEPRDIFRQQIKLLNIDLMDSTPPFPPGSDGSGKDAQEVGINAVIRDITRAITPASDIFKDAFTDKELEKIVQRKDYDKLNARLPHLPGLSHWTAMPFTADLHKSQKRYHGQAKEMFQMTMDERKWKQYRRETTGHVGYVKSGWGYTAAQLGGKVPAWVSKHFPYTKGRMEESPENAEKYWLQFSNDIDMKLASKYQFAVSKRNREMMENLAFRLKRRAKERGFKVS